MRSVGCCWLKFENGQIFHPTFVDVAWCCSRLARSVQQFCPQAWALVRFSIPNILQRLATGWPNARNMLRPTMLRYVAFTCCARLAPTCRCWASNVGICRVKMLRPFGGALYNIFKCCMKNLTTCSHVFVARRLSFCIVQGRWLSEGLSKGRLVASLLNNKEA